MMNMSMCRAEQKFFDLKSEAAKKTEMPSFFTLLHYKML